MPESKLWFGIADDSQVCPVESDPDDDESPSEQEEDLIDDDD